MDLKPEKKAAFENVSEALMSFANHLDSVSVYRMGVFRYMLQGRGACIFCFTHQLGLAAGMYRYCYCPVSKLKLLQLSEPSVVSALETYDPEREVIVIVALLTHRKDVARNALVIQRKYHYRNLFLGDGTTVRTAVTTTPATTGYLPFRRSMFDTNRCAASDCNGADDPQTTLRRCANCSNVWYCSRPCQKRHWTTHRGKCHSTSHYRRSLKWGLRRPRNHCTTTTSHDTPMVDFARHICRPITRVFATE